MILGKKDQIANIAVSWCIARLTALEISSVEIQQPIVDLAGRLSVDRS